ncbi:MAG: hypothetical protein D6737_06625 [Chloroflexi bacterium]|nr:MAG: hypothetical protein CUN54_02675 [Phototrophicales bacterium]RMF80875.1 MAG: hypothetical protein D6737_06625 [Chloroflexota bacterium]
MDSYLRLMRGIIDEAGAKPLRQVMMTPGAQAVYRLTVHYPDGRFVNSVATMVKARLKETRLWIVHVGRRGNKPLQYRIPEVRYEQFVRALHNAHFDKLKDHESLPLAGTDFWLIERASGTFVKSLLIATSKAEGDYAALIHAIHHHLPEAVRTMRS